MAKKYPGPENEAKRVEQTRAGVAALAAQLPPLPKVSWEKIVEHIDHAVKLAGADHVGLGSDFDGASMPEGMEDVTRLPKITEELLRRGYTEAQIKGILGENLLRLMERVEGVAQQIYNEAFSKDREFFDFWYTMTAYRDSLLGSNTRYVGPLDGDFFRYFGDIKGKRPPTQRANQN